MVDENAAIQSEIMAFHSDTKIWVVENRGYDVGPFVDFLHHIDLNDYDFVLKLHSKGVADDMCALYINGIRLTQKLWCKFLFSGLLGSSKLFRTILTKFSEIPSLGMVGAKRLITNKEETSAKSRAEVEKLMARLGYPVPKEIRFIAGTMFMCRAKLLASIKQHLSIHDFALTDGTVKDGTLAHALERVFGTITVAQGYEIKGFDCHLFMLLRGVKPNIKRFIYQRKITKNSNYIIKIFKLPIYYKKLN
jgi:lipopolysaccharide biosynthesis protein